MLRRAYLFGVVIVVAALAAAVTVPIVCLVILGLRTQLGIFKGQLTLDNYTSLLTDPATRDALFNTIIFTAGGAILAIVLGTTMAFAVTSVRIPARSVFRVLPILVLILPPLVKDPSWIILFSPKTGLVNLMLHSVFGISKSFINVFTMYGMITAIGVFTAPFAYIIMLTPLERIDRSFMDASRTLGAPLTRTLRRVVIPMIRPALLSAVTLLVIMIASAFETPVIIGMPGNIHTFMSQIFQSVNSPLAGLNSAAAQGSLYVVLTGIMVVLYLVATRNERRFVSISGRGHSHEVLEGKGLRWGLAIFMGIYSLFGFVGPLVVTILTSLVPFYSAVNGNPFRKLSFNNYDQVFTKHEVFSSIVFSTWFGILVAIGSLVAAGLLSTIALKSNSRFRRVAEVVGMAPIAIPALVYSVGLLLAALSIPGFTQIAYGTKWLMYLAEIIVFLPITMRVLSSALIQVQDELLEASTLAGAHFLRTVRSILVPILRPALLYTASVVFVFSYRELGAIVFLVPTNTSIVPNVAFAFYVSGGYPMLSALNIVSLIVPLIMVCLFVGAARLGSRASERRGRRAVRLRPIPVA